MYLIRPLWSALFLLLLLTGTAARAQDCVLGVYGDEGGTYLIAGPDPEQPWSPNVYTISVYYVVHAEAFVMAAAWQREYVPSYMGLELVATEAIWQPYATFLETREEGYRIGLGICRPGYGGAAITIMKELLYLQYPSGSSGTLHKAQSPMYLGAVRILPNALQDPENPVISDCAGVLSPCEQGEEIRIYSDPVPVESESFGRIKSLFRP